MTRLILALAFVAFANTVLADDRPVTPDEQAALAEALSAVGCSGGKSKFDIGDNEFEVTRTTCDDDKLWKYRIDTSYNVIS